MHAVIKLMYDIGWRCER